jgi:predicted ferric reductase
MAGVLLLLIYLALALAPLGLARLAGLPPRPFWDDLSSGLAMVAFATLLIEFVLSGRFRSVSGHIGMDITMRFHQLLARTVLALILLHPFLYTLPMRPGHRAVDLTRAEHLHFHGPAVVAGWIGWVALAALVITAIWRDKLPMRYEGWRLMHGLGAALVAGMGTIHVLKLGRYTEAEPRLEAFWLGLLAVAIFSLAYVYLIAPLIRSRRPFAVEGVRRIAERTWELVLAPGDGRPFPFRAGQFVWLSVRRAPFGVTDNPFSISSAPAQGGRVEFVIKEAGDFTGSLDRIPEGARAWLDGPHGTLTLPGPKWKGVGLIAGGVGVAPMLSILRQMQATGDGRPAVLLYGNRAEGQIVYREELDRLAAGTGATVHHVLSEPPPGWTGLTGMIDPAAIAAAFGPAPGPEGWIYMLCGPPPMLDSAEAALLARGVPPGHIHAERFVYD